MGPSAAPAPARARAPAPVMLLQNRPRFLQLFVFREIGEPFGVEGGGDRGLPLEHLVDEVLAVRAVLLLRFRPLFLHQSSITIMHL